MIILDPNHISLLMRSYLEDSRQPVMKTPMAERLRDEGVGIVLVEVDEAIRRIEAGERLYAMSESHLGWLADHVERPDLLHAVNVCKDKARMRKVLSPLFPELYFESVKTEDLLQMACPKDRLPLVVKPAVGFLSMGIHVVRSEEDWNRAMEQIAQERTCWGSRYARSVVDGEHFIAESLIEGTEYAVDVYFDGDGQAHVLDILRHDFANAADTSDRLYVTGPAVIREQLEPMTRFLNEANRCMGMRDFPCHVEVRNDAGRIRPIEFNPLRFAGLGGTEMSYYAYGFFTFDRYLKGQDANWDEILPACDEGVYTCLSCLDAPAGTPRGAQFDYAALRRDYLGACATEPFNNDESGFFGFLFWKTSAEDTAERTAFLNNDLRGYLR